jgi:hypothetical protein
VKKKVNIVKKRMRCVDINGENFMPAGVISQELILNARMCKNLSQQIVTVLFLRMVLVVFQNVKTCNKPMNAFIEVGLSVNAKKE